MQSRAQELGGKTIGVNLGDFTPSLFRFCRCNQSGTRTVQEVFPILCQLYSVFMCCCQNPCRYIGNLAGTIAVLGQLVFQITRNHHLWVALKFGTRRFSAGALALVALCLSSFDQGK